MTDKTVKEVAEMLGVTKQTVQYHLKSLPTNYTTKSDKNIIYIKPLGQKTLSDKIDKRKHLSVDKETVKTDKEIDHFKEQIKEKDQQIAQLLESQKQLQKLIENQQVLTLQANQKIENLELTLNDDEISSVPTKNKRKWTDFFKKRKQA
ncbi:helix-turn-helix transcriptional regulator [Latilactobacillus curvatus]|uniref:helix-turn-helix transcriptional regulator n=1 Tax=Latilactobacillus curvatus TaxID=28038 RepID=UPI000B5EBA62|nr:DUF536 domain-containing protein [Latilactobacillus curvatus]ASN61690.1 hypothetical protein CGZ47_03705 [Latilactobacillus curvatus]MCT2880714.1 DUF536 domain-containing protein [Latilactobacillus curvatus]MDG2983992.1 DUF536 domain-containing protein [Latilactobacillus curvatus]UTC10311.1 hypothetical protein A4W79_03290 [Latilactobacillus curvatus]